MTAGHRMRTGVVAILTLLSLVSLTACTTTAVVAVDPPTPRATPATPSASPVQPLPTPSTSAPITTQSVLELTSGHGSATLIAIPRVGELVATLACDTGLVELVRPPDVSYKLTCTGASHVISLNVKQLNTKPLALVADPSTSWSIILSEA